MAAPSPRCSRSPADAYVRVEDAGPKLEPDEEWRARGRQVIVEREGDDRDLLRAVAESKDHFVVHRPDPEAPDIDALDEDWRAGQHPRHRARLGGRHSGPSRSRSCNGLIPMASSSISNPTRGRRWRPPPVKLQGLDSPLLIVDPLLSGRAQGQAEVETSEEAMASALDSVPGLHLVLAATTAAAAGSLPEHYANRVLMGDPGSSRVAGDRRRPPGRRGDGEPSLPDRADHAHVVPRSLGADRQRARPLRPRSCRILSAGPAV